MTAPYTPPAPKLPLWALLQQAAASTLKGVANIPADITDFFDFAAPSATGKAVEHRSTTRDWRGITQRLRELSAPPPATRAEELAGAAGELYGGVAGSFGLPAGLWQLPTLRTVARTAPKLAAHVEQLAPEIAARPDGFTFDPHGGRFLEQADGGFIVANPKGNKPAVVDEVTPEVIQKVLDDNRALLRKPGMMLGGWRDGSTGKYYLEVSQRANSVDEALELAKQRNEKAVFNLGEMSEIPNPHYRSADMPTAPTPQPELLPAVRTADGRVFTGYTHSEAADFAKAQTGETVDLRGKGYAEPTGQFYDLKSAPLDRVPAFGGPRFPAGEAKAPPAPTPQEPEKIVAAAVKGRNGGVYSGVGHDDAFQAAVKAGEKSDDLWRNVQSEGRYGFVTDRGRFLTQEEAVALAEQSGANVAPGQRKLFSEDLPTAPTPPAKAMVKKGTAPRITALQAAEELIRGRKPLTDAPTGIKTREAARRGVAEVQQALAKPGNALDWYREAVGKMEENTKALFPQTAQPENMSLFKMILAITSNGNKVDANYRTAAEVYRNYLKGGKLEMGEGVMRSPRWRTHDAQLKKLGRMLEEKGQGPALDELLGERNVLKKGTRMEPAAAAEFGPKIGRFFWNLHGKHGEVTVDLWATRTWRRWMGEVRTRTDRVTGKTVLDDAPDAAEKRMIRQVMTSVAKKVGAKAGQELAPADVQALLWFYEQELHRMKGAKNVSRSFAEAAADFRAKHAAGF